MCSSLEDSVLSVTSSDPANSSFGTGFVVHREEHTTYLLTCAHVIRSVGGEEQVRVDNHLPAKVIAIGEPEWIDLAVICVEGLSDREPLRLDASGQKGATFRAEGFQQFKQGLQIKPVRGQLGEYGGLESRQKTGRIGTWDLVTAEDYYLKPGYSGSPVIDETSQGVIGVVVVREERSGGKIGVAISIEALSKIWPGIPDGLVSSKRGKTRLGESISYPFRGLTEEDWENLLSDIVHGRCTPFIGAGSCAGVLTPKSDIAKKWAEKYGFPFKDSFSDLAQVSQFLAVTQKIVFPQLQLEKEYENLQAPKFDSSDEPHGVLADLPFSVYVTTNYDDFMVQALTNRNRTPIREYCRWDKSLRNLPSVFESDPAFEPSEANPLVFHLYGYPETLTSMVVTEDNYLEFLVNVIEHEDWIPVKLKRIFSNTALLFLGYQIVDWDFRILFRFLSTHLQNSLRPTHISVQLVEQDIPEEQKDSAQQYLDKFFGDHEISVYWGNCSDFVEELRSRWEVFQDGD